MSFSWFIARRYLTARRRQAFISLISAVSILGVAVGVMALIIALALMTGVQSELRNRIVGGTAHVYVYKLDGSFADVPAERTRMALPGVVGLSPTILGPALLESANRNTQFATLHGIDPAHEPEVTDISKAVASGSLRALEERPAGAKDGVVLGVDLAHDLGVEPGDLIWANTAALTSTPGGLVPHRRPLQVVGTVRFGFYQMDTTAAFVTLETAAALLAQDGPDMMQLRLADMERAPAVRDQLQDLLGAAYQVKDWTDMNQELYSALWLEKVAISLTIGLIVMVAALNIVASLVLLVMEKTRDIAILRTMGAPARLIRRIFIYQGLTIGFLGTGIGTTLGLAVCYLGERYKLIRLSATVYQIAYLPFRVEPVDVAVVVASALVVCLVATLYPSRQAGRIDPAEALRNQ
ncbi:MAG: ABC transporter permease [Vicinamibacterales bacterium]